MCWGVVGRLDDDDERIFDGLLRNGNIGCIYFGIYGVYRKMSMMYM